MTKLRIYDQVSAKRVDHFIAGSENAKKRIKRVYGTDSEVVYPFIDLKRFKDVESFDGGYFVVVARPNKYKRADLAKLACLKLGLELKIISGDLSDVMVVKVLAGCRALIIPGEEDFGLVSLEAQALGKGVIAYGKGGNLETVIDQKTGVFFQNQTRDSLIEAIQKYIRIKLNPDDCRKNAKSFSKENFKRQLYKYLLV